MISSVLVAHLSGLVKSEDVTNVVGVLKRLELHHRVVTFDDLPEGTTPWHVESEPYDCLLLLAHGNTTEAICECCGIEERVPWGRYLERVAMSFPLANRLTLINGCCYGGSPSAVTRLFASADNARYVIGPSRESSHDDILTFTPLLLRELRKPEGNLFGLIEAVSPYLSGQWTANDAEEWASHVVAFKKQGHVPILSTVRRKAS